MVDLQTTMQSADPKHAIHHNACEYNLTEHTLRDSASLASTSFAICALGDVVCSTSVREAVIVGPWLRCFLTAPRLSS